MRLRTLSVLLLTASCGSRPAATTSRGPDAAPAVSPACQLAREARSKAAALDRDGHEILALAKL
ncbi:MAG TPA: hypothetical protein VLM85_16545, partial [Polyangiaceae bacterium]|nr:hypothetical protein [Polyangiaceae bacterium]